ncbi:MAG: hypothetical protein ACI84E_001665 [Planctomycetota bacterium]
MADSNDFQPDQALSKARGSNRQVFVALAVFALLLISARFALAAVSTDTYERGEELVRGAVAVAVTGGLDLPLENTFYHTYEGGGFVQALVTIPAFALLGPSFLAHKVAAIAVDLLVLLAGCLLARRAFGFRALVLFGLLHIFAPITFQKLGLLNLGIHYHALFFQFAVAGLTLRLLQEKARVETPWRGTALALGVLGGFGFFYNYQLAPLIGLAGLVLLYRKALTPKGWLHLVGGCILGLLPLLFMGARVGGEVFNVHSQVDVEEQAETAEELAQSEEAERAIHANAAVQEARDERRRPSLAKLPAGILDAMGPRGFLQLLALLALPLAGLELFRRRRKVPSTSSMTPICREANQLLLGYLAIFGALIPVTGFMVVYFPQYFLAMRYAPFWGFATVLTAGTLAWLSMDAQAVLRWAGRGLIATCLGLGFWSFGHGLATGQVGSLSVGIQQLADLRGTDFNDYYSKLATRLELSHVESLRVLTAVEGAPEKQLFAAASEAVYKHSLQTLPEILQELKQASPDKWQLFLPGLGAWALKGRNGSLLAGGNKLFRQVSKLPEGPEKKVVSDLVFFGLGRRGSFWGPKEEFLNYSIQELELGKFPPSALRGFGHHCYHFFQLNPDGFAPFIASHRPKTKRLVSEGFEEARRERSLSTENE